METVEELRDALLKEQEKYKVLESEKAVLLADKEVLETDAQKLNETITELKLLNHELFVQVPRGGTEPTVPVEPKQPEPKVSLDDILAGMKF